MRRRKNELIFCSVSFNKESKSYYYLTEDDNIDIGNYVVVPVGNENKTTIAIVVGIEYFTKENAPFSLDKIKQIIRKCTKEEIEQLEDES